MLKRLLSAMCLCLLAASTWAQTQTTGAGTDSSNTAQENPVQLDAAAIAPEKILVVGQRPGPGLWKISKGEHVLWIFGTYSPLPKHMVWRSQQVENILANSQEYLTPPSASAHVGFFKGLTLLPHVFGLRKNPGGAQLRDVLPADVYARWLPLKQKYIGSDDGIERDRPLFVAGDLFRKGLEQAGLSSDKEVRATIEKIVKKNNIKTTHSDINLEMDDPAKAMKEFKKSQIDDVACFSMTLDQLETDIDAMRVRANAWAKGDLEAIQKLSYADREEACSAAMRNSSFTQGQPGLQKVEARMREAWLAAAEKSLASNASTFAVLPLKYVLDQKGFLAALQAKGYALEKPE
jgi:uncharacterized protein YbaP (TraB family)